MCHTHTRNTDQIPIRILNPRKNMISRDVTTRDKTPSVSDVISAFLKEGNIVTSPYKEIEFCSIVFFLSLHVH